MGLHAVHFGHPMRPWACTHVMQKVVNKLALKCCSSTELGSSSRAARSNTRPSAQAHLISPSASAHTAPISARFV